MVFSSDNIKIPEHLKGLETVLHTLRYTSDRSNPDKHIAVLQSLLTLALSNDKKEETIKAIAAYIEFQRSDIQYQRTAIEEAVKKLDKEIYILSHWTVRSEKSQEDVIKKG